MTSLCDRASFAVGLLAICAAVLLLWFVDAAVADEYAYVSDQELAEELAVHQRDIGRTTQRITALNAEIRRIEETQRAQQMEIAAQQQGLSERVRLLYRLSKSGSLARYIFGSHSAMELLRRLHTLRHVVLRDLSHLQDLHEQLARRDQRLGRLISEKRAAEQMLLAFKSAYSALTAEQAGRNGFR